MFGSGKRLEAFRISGFRTEKRLDGDEVGTFETQFDPDSYTRRFVNEYEASDNAGINISMPSSRYLYSHANQLSFQLIVDASESIMDLVNVPSDDSGLPLPAGVDGITKDVNEFLRICYDYDGDIHQPRFLKIEWSDFSLSCRLHSVDIQYTMFSREGTPIRAKLDTVFLGDVSEEVRLKMENRQSPDISRQHIIKHGDSLPMISKKYYGSNNYFLLLAKYNQLDHFRELSPGAELEIPVLKKLLELVSVKSMA